VLADGLRVALAADTLLAAARDLGDLDLVALADCALHRNHSTLDQVRAVAGQRRQGARRLRAVIPLLDGRSESPWESVLRILHRAADIEVEPQYKIVDDEGAFVARVDLWLVGTQRVHEYDGAVHREASVHQQDLSREGAMVQIGWQRIGFTSRHLLTRGASIIAGADQLLGRSWDPRRLAAWNRLLAESVCTASGRARLRSRWARSTYSRRPPAQ
jgi:very-short-patch-repair endonuclease